jgi:hypothetical protein
MKIKAKAGGPRAILATPGIELKKPVQFDAKGVADVPSEVGKALCAKFENIVPVSGGAKKKKESDA